MSYIEVNGIRTFYTDDGEGDPPLLLLHGWTCDSLDYSWQIEALAARHRVMAVDMRGHGRSSPGPSYELAAFSDDVAALAGALDLGPVVVVGHSLGGAIASAFALAHPELVQALVTIDPAVGLGPETAAVAEAVSAELSGPGANQFLAQTWVAMEGPASASGLTVWHRRRMLAYPPEFLSAVWGAHEASGLLYRPSADEHLARRTCPVLTFYVDRERAEWEETTFRHPYSRAVAWEGTGHWLHQERPLEFNQLVLRWLDGLTEVEAMQRATVGAAEVS